MVFIKCKDIKEFVSRFCLIALVILFLILFI